MSFFDEFATGAGGGALTGAAVSGGNPYAIVGGAIIGGALSVFSASEAENIAEEEARELERNRVNAVIREIGAQQQAAQTALLATAQKDTSKNTRRVRPNNVPQEQGVVGPNSEAMTDEGILAQTQRDENSGGNTGTF